MRRIQNTLFPSYPFQINQASPFAVGLLTLVVSGNGGAVELAQPRAVTTVGTKVTDREGSTVRDFAITASGASELDFSTGGFSIAVWARLTAGITSNKFPTLFARRTYVSESNNQGWEIAARNDGSGHRFGFRSFKNNGSASYDLLSSSTPAAGLWFIVGTSDGTTRRLYVNGRQETTTTNNPNPNSSTANIINTSDTDQLPILYGAAWRRTLGDSEIWQLYQSHMRWSFLFPSFRNFIPVPPVPAPPVDSWHPAIQQPYIEPLGVGSY